MAALAAAAAILIVAIRTVVAQDPSPTQTPRTNGSSGKEKDDPGKAPAKPKAGAKAKRKARKGRNPQTGAELKIPAHNVPKFRPGMEFKQAVK